MSHPSDLPGPASRQHDANGYLVGLVFDSAPPLLAPASNLWRIAGDRSDKVLRAVATATQRAGKMTVCTLRLVNLRAWLGEEAAATELASRAWRATGPAGVSMKRA